jgi:putative ABC transport system permease protein
MVVLQEIRHAIRGLMIDRGVTAVVMVCLALGVGINATLFSIVDGVLIQPLPFQDPARLVALNETFERGGIKESWVSYQNLQDWKRRSQSFTSIVASASRSLALSDGREATRYEAGATTWDLFPTLGVPPAMGRPFNADDDRPGAEPVVIIGDELWARRYHRDRDIIGKRVLLNARPFTIVGVMPPDFDFPQHLKLWIPLAPGEYQAPRDAWTLNAFARLKPGVDIAAAGADLNAIAKQLAAEHPGTDDGRGVLVRTIADKFIPPRVRLILSTMMGAVNLVLLIACANVANVMLSRAVSRQREFIVRSALGAGRGRLIRQLLTEYVILGLSAAPLGLVVAYAGIWLLDRAVPPDSMSSVIHWQISWRGIAYTTVVSAVSGLVFGLAPALQAGRLNLQEALRDGTRGSGQSGRRARLRNGLVVVEIATSLILLVGAALFVRSFLNLQAADLGFETSPLLTLRVYMPDAAYTTGQKEQRVDEIIRRIERLPGVTAAFASTYVPLSGGGSDGAAVIEGQTAARGEEPRIGYRAVTPHIVRTMGLSMIKGRDLTETEATSRSNVALIDDTMARRLWAGKDPIGQRFRIVKDDIPGWFTVIGVVPDIRGVNMDAGTPRQADAYIAFPYGVSASTGFTIRTSGNPASLTASVRNEIHALDSGLAIFDVRTMEELRQFSFWQFRLLGFMFGIFGAAALFLAAVGVYGVLAFSVSQRRQEMGVRIALGAQQRDVLRLVVGQGLSLAAVGVCTGLVGAFGITRVIASLLYNVTPTDPISFGGVSVFLAAIAAVASYIPARRAMKVDPIVALRME